MKINVDDASSEAATVGISATVEEHLNQIDSMVRQRNIYNAKYDSDYDDVDDNCLAVISESNNLREVELVNMKIQFRNTENKALVDSGSVCTIGNKT